MGGIFGGGKGEPLGLPDPIDFWGGKEEQSRQDALNAAEIQAKGAEKAAILQKQAADDALYETQRQFDTSRGDQMPWLESGTAALNKQQALLGLGGQAAQQQAYDQFTSSPGQKWLQDKTMQGVLNNASAIGGLGGGNVRQALQENAQGLAAQEYNNYYNQIAGLSGTGQNSSQNLGALGAQQGQTAAGLINQSGQAAASGLLGGSQARASGLLTGAQQRMGSVNSNRGMVGSAVGMIGAFSDVNLKKNISDFTDKDLKCCYDKVMNLDLKHWEYKDNTGLPTGVHIGPMYQESPEEIKADDKTILALDIHKENMLIAGALQYINKERVA
tara:strand:- start:2856 stop:3845 length:990 start_codon:yes stop_codon:yes gene_type:complete